MDLIFMCVIIYTSYDMWHMTYDIWHASYVDGDVVDFNAAKLWSKLEKPQSLNGGYTVPRWSHELAGIVKRLS